MKPSFHLQLKSGSPLPRYPEAVTSSTDEAFKDYYDLPVIFLAVALFCVVCKQVVNLYARLHDQIVLWGAIHFWLPEAVLTCGKCCWCAVRRFHDGSFNVLMRNTVGARWKLWSLYRTTDELKIQELLNNPCNPASSYAKDCSTIPSI
ncbi:hypothetical protein POTOM_036582 [Populus tomentosa]|uniref:Uncharacterized protein n=1 Tax=Populus tomentosa TaxID=118781 RepID=A0A8X7Z0H6_POPTO|nr:hypothetical protein POTOM_036582 [Populus tomentosa]